MKARCSSTSRHSACTVTSSATRRSTARRKTAQEAADNDPITRLRERLGLGDDEFDAFDTEAHEIVDAALEFAQNGTDPQPEDALKNVYA